MSLSAPRLEGATEKEDRGAGEEQHELASHVAAKNPVEESDPGHEEANELERSREQVHGPSRGFA